MLGSNGAVPWWVGPAVVAFGAIFLTVGVSTLLTARRRRRTWVPRPGRVVGSRLDGDGHLRLQVTFQDRGRDITFWNRFTSSTGVDQIGRDVDVLVNPEDPTDAVVVRGAAPPSLVAVAFLVFGTVAAAVGIVLTVGSTG